MEQHNVASTRGAALWVVAAVGYLVLEASAAAAFEPSYSYAHNYISDLGLPGGTLVHGRPIYSPRAYLMHAAFCLQGVLFFLGASLIVRAPDNRRTRVFLGTAAANAVGNVVIAAVPGGTVHIAGAALAIVGGNAAILTGPGAIGPLAGRRRYRLISKAIGVGGLSCLAMLIIHSATATTFLLPDGAWERGSVYSITVWQLFTAAWLTWTTRAAARSGSPQRPGPRR